MNKTLIWGLVVIIVLGALIYYVASDERAENSGAVNNTDAKGRVVVSFTDAAANMNNINDVTLEVNRVELYSETEGWVTVAATAKEYKLLELNRNNETRLYGEAEMEADIYTRARVNLGDVTVHTKNAGDKEATKPTSNIETEIIAIVDEGKTTSLKFDILADKSLYTTAKGDYIFSPAVEIEARSNATITTSSSGALTLSGGVIDTDKSAGMDIDGNMKEGFILNTNMKLDVNTSGNIIDLGIGSST